MSKKIKLPKYVAEKIARKHSDFNLDFFCTGGPGGQNQNKRKNGVRITDSITGISAESRDQKEQSGNKKQAFFKIVERLIEFYKKEAFEQVKVYKPGCFGGESLRTYKEKNDLVIDSRSEKTFSYKKTLNGELGEIHEKVKLSE